LKGSILVAVVLVFSLYMIAAYLKFLNRLRAAHPATWTELGQPSLSLRSAYTYDHRWKVRRFIWSGAYRALGDADLSRYAQRIRVGYVLGPILAVLWLLFATWQR
jgi:hypothetical protein